MLGSTLARYFGLRFLTTTLIVFVGVFALTALVDYIETMRASAGEANATALLVARISLFRVPQITERIMPFAVLIGAMASYLTLSRRLELVIARSTGMSAWQFVMPAVIVALFLGAIGTALYNPAAALLQERSKRIENDAFGGGQGLLTRGSGFWLRQRNGDGQSIIHASTSGNQGMRLGGVTVFSFDHAGRFAERIEAKTAVLRPGSWRLSDAHIYGLERQPLFREDYSLATSLTSEQIRESFATPETVPFWELPSYIRNAEHTELLAAGYSLQFHKLLSRPFLLAAMVLLAAAVSLRFFRFGGVQKMVLTGVASGFLLYVLSKVTEDLSKADLMHPVAAAWLPVLFGSLTGFMGLLYQEDG